MCIGSGTKMSILQHLFSFGRAGATGEGRCGRRHGTKNKISAAPFLAETVYRNHLVVIKTPEKHL